MRYRERERTDPGIPPITPRNLDPQVHHPILEIPKLPKQGLVNPRIAMPALILAARKGMHVQNGIQPLRGTGIDDSIDETEPVRSNGRGIQVIEEMAMVDWYANAV